MKRNIVKNLWQYEIIQAKEYGYTLIIYKNNIEVYRQSGFGSIMGAEHQAEYYFLLSEFNIDLGDK